MKKVAIITGAGRGLGKELAALLALRGYALVINARRAHELEERRRRLSLITDVVAVAADVSVEAEKIAEAALSRFGRVDLLINNASEIGPSPMPRLDEFAWEDLLRIYRVNVVAPIHLTQLVLPDMKRRGSGTIVNISSDAGANAYPGWGGYGSSKAALEHASRVLAEELKGSGVRVLVVDPGDMNTEMHRLAEPGVDLSHLPHPSFVAPSILALLDDPAPFARVQAQAMLGAAT
jgi:NAD(P)-dependent dehydrogenase (short-subunit alcohol dehydrogenase family)